MHPTAEKQPGAFKIIRVVNQEPLQLPFFNIRVKQVVGFMGQGCTKILLIELLYAGVFVGEADWHIPVKCVQVRSAFSAEFFPVLNGLTAAASAAGGTGHDFHKVVVDLAALNRIDQFRGVAKSNHPDPGLQRRRLRPDSRR